MTPEIDLLFSFFWFCDYSGGLSMVKAYGVFPTSLLSKVFFIQSSFWVYTILGNGFRTRKWVLMIEMTIPFIFSGTGSDTARYWNTVPPGLFFSSTFLKVYPIHCINASLYRYIIGDSHTRCINRSRLSRSSDHCTMLLQSLINACL